MPSDLDVIDQPRELATINEPSEVAQLIRIALDKGQNPTELYAILREERASRAEQAFTLALSAFQRDCPGIPKKHKAGGITKSGAKFEYLYANKPEIRAVIDPYLSKHGFAVKFGSREPKIAGTYTAVCFVKHIGGHTEATEISGPIDKGHMTDVQQIGSTQTYYERYALGAALGLDVGGVEDDGAGTSGGNAKGDKITEAQQNGLNDLLIEVFADRAKFLKYCGVEKLADIKVSNYAAAVAALEAKRQKAT
jgi:hypothetical protein